MTLYHSILTNLTGSDREEALEVIEDDVAFDRWLIAFDERRKKELRESERARAKQPGGRTRLSREMVEKRFVKVHGGQDDGT